jgi:hypothetical protein
MGFANESQNFKAGFIIPTLNDIFSSILFTIFNWREKTYSRKEIQNFLSDC